MYSTGGPRHSLTRGQKVKGQGHTVIKCAVGVALHVDMTASDALLRRFPASPPVLFIQSVNKSQLAQMDPRDALHHVHRAVQYAKLDAECDQQATVVCRLLTAVATSTCAAKKSPEFGVKSSRGKGVYFRWYSSFQRRMNRGKPACKRPARSVQLLEDAILACDRQTDGRTNTGPQLIRR